MIILTLLDAKHRTPLQQWRFVTESLIRIGRSADNHVVLSDRTVSRHHLELRKSQIPGQFPVDTWYVVNRSLNGTYLDGEGLNERTALPSSNRAILLQLARHGPILRCQVIDQSGMAGRSHQALPPEHRLGQPQVMAPSIEHCSHPGNSPNNLFCIHCGWPLQVSKAVRQYQVLRVLGRGGMGTTYLAWHPHLSLTANPKSSGQLLVLKEMNADVLHIPKAQELFEREAKALQMLQHPGIPRFYDFFIEAGQKYLVMELVHGQDLEHWMQQHRTINPSQAIAWMIQTCEVLHYLHQQEPPIIHRDIKPSNLLVRAIDQRIVVLDFGAVKAFGAPSGTRIGAEGFAAPEQAQGHPTIQSDIYAVGASLLFLLSGKSPRLFHQQNGAASPLHLGQAYPFTGIIRTVIERAMAPQPQERYATAHELADALRQCVA